MGPLLTKDHTVHLGPAGARLRAVHLVNDLLLDLGDGVAVEDLDGDGINPFILDNHAHRLPGDTGRRASGQGVLDTPRARAPHVQTAVPGSLHVERLQPGR